MQKQVFKYYKTENKVFKYQVVVPVYKFKHENAYRYETIELGSNVRGQVVYNVVSTGFSTLNYEQLQSKFKALRYISESEFLAPLN